MDAVVNWLWQGCIVAVAMMAMLRLLERSRAQIRYVVCWMALVTVCVLPLISLVPLAASPVQVLAISTASDPIVSIPNAWWTSTAVILGAWALWSCVYGVRLARSVLALRHARSGCGPFPPTVEVQLRHWGQVSRVGRRAALAMSDTVRAAGVLGCGSPVIAVAPALVQHLSADDLDRVVIHEWAHVQRRDDVANVVQIIARVIAGWHPAVWWIDRQIQIEREVACDERTVAVTGSPKSYAACLTRLARLPRVELGAFPALGALSSPALGTRIVRIVSRTGFTSPSRSRTLALSAIVVLWAVAWALGGVRLVETSAVSLEPQATPRALAQLIEPNGFDTKLSLVRPPATLRTDGRTPVVRHSAAMRTDRRDASSIKSSPPLRRATDRQPPAFVSTPSVPTTAASAAAPLAGRPAVRIDSSLAPPTAYALSPTDNSLPLHSGPAVTPLTAGPQTVSPWGAAATAGVATGRNLKNAGVATGGAFSRFGKRIASSF